MSDDNCVPTTKRRCKCKLLLGLVLGLITAVCLYMAYPPQYEARALILIRAVKQHFIFDVRQQDNYDKFVNTQIALMKSPNVLDQVLEDPFVATLPIVLEQKKNGRGWLRKKLNVRPEGKSEIVTISIKTDNEEASERIVNAVVDCYFTFIDDIAKQADNKMLMNLQSEKRKQQQVASLLHEDIRTKTRQAASQDAASEVVDVSFNLAQLARVDKTLELIDDRIITIQSEQQAPGQIAPLSRAVSMMPNYKKRTVIVGLGFTLVFFTTLLLGRWACCCQKE